MRSVRFRGEAPRHLWERGPALWASALVALTVFFGNFTYVTGLRTSDPLLYESGLGSPTQGGSQTAFSTAYSEYPSTPRFGDYTIDPNNGWTVQALGRLASRMWMHGHVPLWNVYEGLGQPLAGEMQSAALFLPFVLFTMLPNGVLAMHIALQLVAGLTTLALLRTMKLSWVAATLGAVLFALNGSFAVMTNAPFNPIAFLPMALWGVELVGRGARRGRRSRLGTWVIALAIGWMLFAGFPETALLEALFVLVWCIARFIDFEGYRRRFVLGAALGGTLGVLLALPILTSLKGFLGFGYTAYHGGESAHWAYPSGKFAAFAFFYLQGALGRGDVAHTVAGYVTLGALAMGVMGLFSSQSRWIRTGISVLILIFALNAYGFSPANALLNAIPGMKSVLLYKYGLIVIEFGIAILAAFALDDVIRGRVKKEAVGTAFLASLAYVGWSLWYTRGHGGFPDGTWSVWVGTLTIGVLVGILILAAFSLRPSGQVNAGVTAAVLLALEAIGSFAVPQVTSSAPRAVDVAPVRYLQNNLGTSRFYSLGPIEANYGSYWEIAQLNVNDLPVPQKFSDLIMNSLKPDPGSALARATDRAFIPYELSPLGFTVPYEKNLFKAYRDKQATYRDLGVKYLVTRPGVISPSEGSTAGLNRVFADQKADIWLDNEAKPYYEVGPGCHLNQSDLFGATVTCARPSTLVRRQLSTPDWSATVNGETKPVGNRADGLFQSVALPSGTSDVSFSYSPKYFSLAAGVSMLVLVGMALDGALYVRYRRKITDRKGIGHVVS